MTRNPALTKEQRVAIVRQSDREPEWKQKKLGEWAAETFQLDFVPSQPTISIVLRQAGKPPKPRGRSKPLSIPVKKKIIKCPQVEKAMVQWLELQIRKDVAVSAASVQLKAVEVTQRIEVTVEGFEVSDGWVDNFMRRHVLRCSFGLSDVETTDSEELEQVVRAVKTRKVEMESGKAGKTSRRVVKKLVTPKDTHTLESSMPPARKRKRDNVEMKVSDKKARR
ncbi:Protein PDC2 [Phytophthora citrophthora]|uniref:Protein PDC2 n=1 Tax=Phytophthora citrophthora TaxID=4793 RepID=A0AAD9GNQ6_9STRA|nr:Protein PDC2 [Phytophthora citrophthora]